MPVVNNASDNPPPLIQTTSIPAGTTVTDAELLHKTVQPLAMPEMSPLDIVLENPNHLDFLSAVLDFVISSLFAIFYLNPHKLSAANIHPMLGISALCFGPMNTLVNWIRFAYRGGQRQLAGRNMLQTARNIVKVMGGAALVLHLYVFFSGIEVAFDLLCIGLAAFGVAYIMSSFARSHDPNQSLSDTALLTHISIGFCAVIVYAGFFRSPLPYSYMTLGCCICLLDQVVPFIFNLSKRTMWSPNMVADFTAKMTMLLMLILCFLTSREAGVNVGANLTNDPRTDNV